MAHAWHTTHQSHQPKALGLNERYDAVPMDHISEAASEISLIVLEA